MRRLFLLVLLSLAVFAVPAVAQTTDAPDATTSCTDDDAATASTNDDGGVPAGTGDTYGGDSGGVPASWDGSDTSADAVEVVGAGDAMAGGGSVAGTPEAVVAQEPEPEPEGPGEEQPGEPGGEPQQPEVPGETPGGEAPGVDTGGGGGLPRTGLEALRIGLLGLVLLLVGARLRAIALRRKRRAPAPEWSEMPPEPDAPVAYAWSGEERDEWGFPDPAAPAPTGLLPSTASARRRARIDEAEPSTVV